MVVVSHPFFFYDKNALCNFGKTRRLHCNYHAGFQISIKKYFNIYPDEKLKCDKYCHLGVKLVNKREFGDNRYGMICENP